MHSDCPCGTSTQIKKHFPRTFSLCPCPAPPTSREITILKSNSIDSFDLQLGYSKSPGNYAGSIGINQDALWQTHTHVTVTIHHICSVSQGKMHWAPFQHLSHFAYLLTVQQTPCYWRSMSRLTLHGFLWVPFRDYLMPPGARGSIQQSCWPTLRFPNSLPISHFQTGQRMHTAFSLF